MTEQQLTGIEKDIKMSMENCACLGRSAYGDYIDKLTRGVMAKIKEYS